MENTMNIYNVANMGISALTRDESVAQLQLPPEIIDHIFRYACILSTSFCISMSQTSTWTRQLALPYLYTTLVIKKLRTATLLRPLLTRALIDRDSPPPHFLPKNRVRSIWITAVSNVTLDIFKHCDNLSNLALAEDNLLWIVHASSPSTSRLSTLPERALLRKPDVRLLVTEANSPDWSLYQFAANNNPSLFFNKVTHLQLGQVGSYGVHLTLSHFTRITHIAIPYHRPQVQNLNDLLRLFDSIASMTFLVVVILVDQLSEVECQQAVRWVSDSRKTNRPVWAVLSKHVDLQAEWEEEARNGATIWDKAVRFTESLMQE